MSDGMVKQDESANSLDRNNFQQPGLINNLSQKQLFRSQEYPLQGLQQNRTLENVYNLQNSNEFKKYQPYKNQVQNDQNEEMIDIHRSHPHFNTVAGYPNQQFADKKSPEFTPLKNNDEKNIFAENLRNDENFDGENIPELTLYMEDILQSAEYQQMKQSLDQI